MTETMLKALAHLQFNYTPTRNDVWHPPRFHVDGLHTQVLGTVLDGVAAAERSPDASPIGVAVRGQRGAGKTHLLSRARELTQLRGGYFFLVNLLDANTFWRSVAASIVDGLHQSVDEDGTTQLHAFLERLTEALGLPVVIRMAVTGRAPLTPDRLDVFVAALGSMSRQIGIGVGTPLARWPFSPGQISGSRTSPCRTYSRSTRPRRASAPSGASDRRGGCRRSWCPTCPGSSR